MTAFKTLATLILVAIIGMALFIGPLPDSTDGRAFIEEFVVKHITGIDLETAENGLGRCPSCEKLHKLGEVEH